MSPKKYEITDELVHEWAEQRYTESFSEMERRYGVPRRVIARRVRWYEKKRQQEEGAAARIAVMSRFLERHLSDLESVATKLLEIVAPPSVIGNLRLGDLYVMEPPPSVTGNLRREGLDVEARLIEPLAFQQVRYRGRLWGPSETARAEALERADFQRGVRRAKALIQGLREHIGADLWPKVKAWEQAASKCEQNWKQLSARSGEIAIQIGSVDVEAVLNLKRRWDLYGSEAILGKPESDWDYMERLLWTPATRMDMLRFAESLEELEQISQDLEDVLTPPQLHKALLEGQCRYCPVPAEFEHERRTQ